MLLTCCRPLIHLVFPRIWCSQLDRQELQAALLLYMKSLARVIPTVVAHELKDMGKLVDIDGHQVKEEIVAVVDEVRAVECGAVGVYSSHVSLFRARARCAFERDPR